MNTLADFLYPAPARRTTLGILGWWERRRLAYNLIVGTAGVVTLGVVSLAVVLLGDGGGALPWEPVVVFGLGANVCYSLGPAVEVLAEKIGGGELLPVGPTLYRLGLTFSVGLALFPSLLVLLAVLLRLVGLLPH